MINLINKAQSELFSYDCCLLSEQRYTFDFWHSCRYDELMEIWGIIWG